MSQKVCKFLILKDIFNFLNLYFKRFILPLVMYESKVIFLLTTVMSIYAV